MASALELTSTCEILEASAQDEFIWVCQTNADPWNATQKIEWTPYPDTTSLAIEKAYQRGDEQTIINEIYRIDLQHFVQVQIGDLNGQRLIRRERRLHPSVLSDIETEKEAWRRERLSFPLSSAVSCSTSEDTSHHGSSFVIDWLLKFTKGKLNVTFDSIFPVLVQGLQYEGQSASAKEVKDIVNELDEVRKKFHGKKDEKRIEELKICCAKLYTKECYIFRVVNTTLRDNDRTKLNTLGPYCYLVYNYIGRLPNDLSIYHRFRQSLRRTASQSMNVYRGDCISHEILEKYRQAAGDNSKYFKWLPFVSTSLKQNVAESFAYNALYIIELQRYSTNDQFTNLNTVSAYQDEEEIVLRPGVRFLVEKVEFDNLTKRHLVYIKIVPSYISNLR